MVAETCGTNLIYSRLAKHKQKIQMQSNIVIEEVTQPMLKVKRAECYCQWTIIIDSYIKTC